MENISDGSDTSIFKVYVISWKTLRLKKRKSYVIQ